MHVNRTIRGVAAALSCAVCLLGGISGSGVNGAAGASHSADSSAGAIASADIARFSIDSPAMIAAKVIAVTYWNTAVCGGEVTVGWAALDPTINATSKWWNPVAAYGNAGGNIQCTITLNQAQEFDWPMFCSVMVHEFGHLTGHEHTTDPTSVMYPIYQTPIPECKGNPPGATGPTTARAASSPRKGSAKGAHKAHSRHRRHRTTKKHA